MRLGLVDADGARRALAGGEVGHVLTGAGVGVVRLVFVVAVGDGHEVIPLVVDQAVVALRKGVLRDLEAVADALILPIDLQLRHRLLHHRIEAVVDDHVDVVVDVHLGDEAGAVGVLELVGADGLVEDLVQLVALEDVAPGRGVEWGAVCAEARGAGIKDAVALLEVVGERVVVGQHQDDLLVQLLDRDVRSVGTGDDLEAVVEQGLGLVVGNAEKLHRGEGVAGVSAGVDHAHRDVVVVARFQRERSGGLQEETVARRVAGGLLGPRLDLLTDGAPLEGVGVAGVHVVGGDVEVGAGGLGDAVSAIGHALSVLPEAAHVVVVVHALARLAVDAAGPVVVEELAHAVALVVHHPIAVADADAAVGNAEGVDGVREDGGERVVHPVRVLIGTLEEVDAHRRRLLAVADGVARRLVEGVAIVAVAESALDVAADVVVDVASEVAVHPLGEVGVGQRLRALVDEHVVAERHVVDLVVGREGEALRADLHADGLAEGLCVHVALVVEDPVVGLVTIERDLVLAPAVAAVDLLEEIVPGVIAEGWVVVAVAVVVIERGEVVVLAECHVAVGGVLEEVTRDGVSVGELDLEVAGGVGGAVEVLAVAHGVLPLGDGEPVVGCAGGLVNLGCALVGQRSGPEVVAVVAVARGGQLELLVWGDAGQPQGAAVDDAHAGLFGHDVGALVDGAVVPEGTAVLEQGPDVVPFEVAQGRGRRASGRHTAQLRGHGRGLGSLGLDRAALVEDRSAGGGVLADGGKASARKEQGEERCAHGRYIVMFRPMLWMPSNGFVVRYP